MGNRQAFSQDIFCNFFSISHLLLPAIAISVSFYNGYQFSENVHHTQKNKTSFYFTDRVISNCLEKFRRKEIVNCQSSRMMLHSISAKTKYYSVGIYNLNNKIIIANNISLYIYKYKKLSFNKFKIIYMIIFNH